MNDAMNVAVVGIGNMGQHYASRLLAAGFRVTVWNRAPEKALPLLEAGAHWAACPADAVAAAALVISAMEHAEAFESTLLSPSVLAVLTARHVIIDMSTVSPDDARAASRRLGAKGARYLDAPVSGGTRGAAAGTLTLLIGGNAADILQAKPVLEVLGRLHAVGPVGSGQTAKLVNQVIVAGTIGAVAEGLVLAERTGLDCAVVLEALQGGFADSRVLREHGARMVQRNFIAGASNRVFLKDLNAIQALAAAHGLDLVLAGTLREGYEKLVHSEFAEEDHSSFWRWVMNTDHP